MTPRKLFILLSAALATLACTNPNQPKDAMPDEPPQETNKLAGDSLLYGMACEGTSDSVLVFLANDGSDPVTYDMLQARLERRVRGRVQTGDNIALLLTDDSLPAVEYLIDIDQLKGQWAYLVMPQLKERFRNMPVTKDSPSQAVRDSMLRKFMVPREYGMRLMRDYSVERIGNSQRRQNADNTPVEYPRQPRYTEWHLWNGKIIFTAGNINIPNISDRYKHEVTYDTAEIVMLRRDSLQLRFGDQLRCYYRKKTENK